MNLEQQWRSLEQQVQGAGGSGIQRLRLTRADQRAVFLGFQKPEDRRVFLLRIAKEHMPQATVLPSMRGVEVWASSLPADKPSHVSLGLTLRDPRFSDIFTALIENLVGHVEDQADDAKAAASFLTRVGRWQRFMESHAEGLSDEAQRGLWGELRFLRLRVLPRLGGPGVEGWTGGRRTPQDFQFPDCAVEVKTSIAKQSQALRISNERQLDDSHVSALFLYHVSLEPLRGTGETLPQSVELLRNALANDPALEAFEDKLIEAGYSGVHAHKYLQVGYSVREENLFRVRDGFPRLIERDLMPGVGGVTYTLSVDECRPFMAPYSDLDAALNTVQPPLPSP